MAVAFTPAVGELWEIDYCDAFHNDAAAPTMSWLFTDGTTLLQLMDAAALAANTRRNLYATAMAPPLYMDRRCTLTFSCGAGATNGAVATINLIGRRIRGTQ
jgi:hypothetical protein